MDLTGDIWVKFTRFHGWNPPDFRVKSTGFQGWNPPPCIHQTEEFFTETLAFIIWVRFHRWNLGEIHQISWVKSTRFQGEFHEILGHSPHPAFIKLKSFCWNTCFYNFGWIWQVISGWNRRISRVKSTGFHGFHEIRRISRVKSAGFHGFHEIRQISWNPPDFTGEIRRISRVKSAGFYGFHEIRRISWWNPPDFMVIIRRISWWNPPDFMKSAGFHEIRRISWMWAFACDDQV